MQVCITGSEVVGLGRTITYHCGKALSTNLSSISHAFRLFSD